MTLRMFSAILLALLLSACVGKHVTFFHPNTVSDAPTEMRLFLDARGDLYPRSGITAEYVLPDKAHGSLFEAARGADPRLCENPDTGSEMTQLCASVATDCHGASTMGCFERWQKVQEEMWERRAKTFASRFSDDGNVTIGVLVHGFNNWFRESQANFATAEKQMLRYLPPGRQLRFVEVYWDGCRSNDKGIGCWAKAQSSGPLVGFSLRRFFNSVEEGWQSGRAPPHWRILTHSSGAFVAGATFGDPTAALPQLQDPTTNRWYGEFAHLRTSKTGPARVPQLSDVRLGMLAPATPFTTFAGGDGQGEGILSNGLKVMTVVQPDDSALNKLVLGCHRFGVSCLGADWKEACALQRAGEASDRRFRVIVYDFSRPSAIWRDEAELHDYSVYVRQAANASTFFRDLMSMGSPKPDSGPLVTCSD